MLVVLALVEYSNDNGVIVLVVLKLVPWQGQGARHHW